jgi:hypothetical protein
MCFRVFRSDGSLIGEDFMIRPSKWKEDLASIKNLPRRLVADGSEYIALCRTEEFTVRLKIITCNDNLDKNIIYLDGNERSWLDFNPTSERKKLAILRDILVQSDIQNGERLSWGMANYFYDAREACSYLIIYYNNYNNNGKIPHPVFNDIVLP